VVLLSLLKMELRILVLQLQLLHTKLPVVLLSLLLSLPSA